MTKQPVELFSQSVETNNQLACYSFIDSGRRHERKDFVTAVSVSRIPGFAPLSRASVPEGTVKGPGDTCAYSVIVLSWQRFKTQINFLANSVLQERNTEFREPDVFIMVIIFAPGELGARYYHYYAGQKRKNLLFAPKEIQGLLSSEAVHDVDSLEKIIQSKDSQCLCLQIGRNVRDAY